jgi:hypothetical protein
MGGSSVSASLSVISVTVGDLGQRIFRHPSRGRRRGSGHRRSQPHTDAEDHLPHIAPDQADGGPTVAGHDPRRRRDGGGQERDGQFKLPVLESNGDSARLADFAMSASACPQNQVLARA